MNNQTATIDWDAFWRCDTLLDVEQMLGRELECIETRDGFDRYSLADDEAMWICQDCGSIVIDPHDGCEICGFKVDDEWTIRRSVIARNGRRYAVTLNVPFPILVGQPQPAVGAFIQQNTGSRSAQVLSESS